jgi:hypothetical protein
MEPDTMADAFQDRGKGYEANFKLDEERRFNAEARRNKMIGLWAAAKMGMSFNEAEIYAKTIVSVNLDEPGPENVMRKIMTDLDAKKAAVSEDDVRSTMVRLYGEALNEISQN